MFQVSDPHYYVYQFDSNGTGADATFTATAFGDLDKDGVLSTFQRTGKGQIDEYGCSAKAAGAITTENELE